ncbi:MAG: hypothetical protein ABJE95_08585 [Byssovorax sp.]
MSVNFYSRAGIMLGLEIHGYKPTPPLWGHVTCVPLSWLAINPSTRTASVSSQSSSMVQAGLELCLIVHGTLPPPSAVMFPVQYAKIVLISSSVAYLSVHKVTGEGAQLACCVSGCFGLNANCNDPIDLPDGGVYQPNTVQTEPTLGDYVAAVIGYALDAILAVIVSALGDLFAGALGLGEIGQAIVEAIVEVVLQTILRFVPQIPGIDSIPIFPGIIIDPSGFGGPIIQKLIDGE